jgi:hypothetical protein
MKNLTHLIWISAIVGVVLNIALSLCISPFATPNQISPPDGAAALGLWDQFVHMLVHHEQVLFTSSLIVFIVVALSVAIALLVRSSLLGGRTS